MVTVSAVVKKIVNEKPMLQEGLRQGLLNFAAVSDKIKASVEQHLGENASDASIIMALRRHAETIQRSIEGKANQELNTQLTLKTNLAYFSVRRSLQLFKKVEELYKFFDYEAGDTLNIIHGNNEISIITNDKYEKKVAALLEKEQVTTKERNLVSISLSLPRDFPYTPGVIFAATRKLYWDNVNIFELVTTATELTFVFLKKDAMRAYESLQELAEEK
jgi:hypothetical protein